MVAWAAVILLMCVLRGQALDLLRAGAISDPPAAPKVHCRCVSYPYVTLCSWPEPSHSPPTNYIATYSERHGQSATKQCHLIQPGSPSFLGSELSSSSERLWHCYLQKPRFLTDYIINVTAVYPSGSSSHLSSFMLEDIIKPDPPTDVWVSPDVMSLSVKWSHPPTWTNLDIIPLKYHVMYQWDNRGTPNSVKLGPFESTNVTLKGLARGRTYLFQVCAKELLDLGECSDWSSAVKVTFPRTKL